MKSVIWDILTVIFFSVWLGLTLADAIVHFTPIEKKAERCEEILYTHCRSKDLHLLYECVERPDPPTTPLPPPPGH